MDDIARDVVQRQAPHERQAHNEYVVTTTPRFPWHGLDRDIQEQILQDAQPHARRYVTNPGGGFNWAQLERGVRAQILQDAPVHSRRYFTNPRGGFNWAELERGVRAQIVRHALVSSSRVHVQTHGEDYLEQFDPSGNWPVPTILDLTIVGRGAEQAWHALWCADAAPTLLQVTFSQRLDRAQLSSEWFEAEDDQARGRGFYDFPPRRTGPQLAELEAQVQRSYVWTGVHSIRLIRHDGDDEHNPRMDEFTVQFVRRGEHGDEVIEVHLLWGSKPRTSLWFCLYSTEWQGLDFNLVNLQMRHGKHGG